MGNQEKFGQSNTDSHTWATFSYTNITINTNFSPIGNLTNFGPPNGTSIKVLSQITFADGSSQRFDYNSYGQVTRFNSHAANGDKLNHLYYNLPFDSTGGQTDCPRFTESKVWAKDWNLDPTNGIERELTTQYTISDNQSFTIDSTQHTGRLIEAKTLTDTFAQDGVVEKVYSYSTGWDEGLPLLSETWATEQGVLVKKRWVTTYYEQDDEELTYILNPRITETKIQDNANTKRTTIGYYYQLNSTASLYGLVSDVIEYDFPATSNQKRRTHTEYNLSTAYTDRRILGLVSEKTVYDNVNNLVSKATFNYDEGDFTANGQNISPIQHDNTSYGASFITGRGLLTSTTRWAVPSQTDPITTTVKYNTAGLPISAKDAMNSEVKTDYTDSFDNITGTNTYAYPTSITDAANNSSYSKYDFYTGAIKRAEMPAPQGQTTGAIKIWSYDSVGRLERTSVGANGNNTDPYTRYVYSTTGNSVETYATITDFNNNNQADAADEVYGAVFTDGFGRTIKSRSDLPNAPSGQYSAAKVEYDQLGRVKRQSSVAEVNESWQVVGDDVANGWLWTTYSYDWKSRVYHTQNPDGTFTSAVYEGCGCAGGEIVTLTDAGTVVDGVNRNRVRKIYSDILGRAYKTQLLNWDNTVYSTVMTKYNTRDQVESVRSYQGQEPSNWTESCPTGTCQETYSTYDGHGRVVTTKKPSQTAPDSFTYFADDTVATKTDARGVMTSYLYNSRKLITNISYTAPQGSNIPATDPTSYTYDAVGNVTSTTDASGNLSFQYDQLSRLTSETKTFTGLSGTFALNYTYALTGQLKSVSDPFSSTVNYYYDKIGRPSQVGGTGYNISVPFISELKYRSWGAVKEMTYGNGLRTNLAYSTKQMPTSYQVINPNISGGSVIGSTYEYYNDGMLRKVANLTDNRFDRAYVYDQAGRLKEALSGAEARGDTTADGPYKQVYNYDVWGNNNNFIHRKWTGGTITDNTPYTNNRHQSYVYDATGQITGSQDGAHGYDASARPTTFASSFSVNNNGNYQAAFETVSIYTGSGIPSKRVTTQRTDNYGTIQTTVTPTYYLRSSVLGGQAVAELNENGARTKGFVYANGMKVTEYKLFTYPTTNWQAHWQHTDPLTGNHFESDQAGIYGYNMSYLDPLGADVTTEPPPAGFEEPSYLDPNKDFFWPVEYQWNDITLVGETRSQRDLAMSQHIDVMDMVSAREAWRRGDISTALGIIERNPNVGLEVRSFRVGETVTFSIFGRDAANFLFGLAKDIASGALVAATPGQASAHLRRLRGEPDEEVAYVNAVGSNTIGGGGSKVKCPPSKSELLANPILKTTLDEAMRRSDKIREEYGTWIEVGGWIYWNSNTGRVTVIFKETVIAPLNMPPYTQDNSMSDSSGQVQLGRPPMPKVKGLYIVATFHTHATEAGPDPTYDVGINNGYKVPGFVRTTDGKIHPYGNYDRGIWKTDLPSHCR